MHGVTDSRVASCETPRASCRSTEAQKPRSSLTFEQWRARRLLPFDMRFLLFLLVTQVVYGCKTAHRLSVRTSNSSAMAHECIVRWLHVREPECSTDVGRSNVAELLLRAPMLRQVLHHVAASIMVLLSPWSLTPAPSDPGILSSCSAIMPWIQSLNSLSFFQHYVHHLAGTHRPAVLLLQRYAQLIGAVISFAMVREQQRDYVLPGHWLTLRQYMYSAWQAAVTVVPTNVQLVARPAEWLIMCGVITATKPHYHMAAAAAAVTQRTTAALWAYIILLPSWVVGVLDSRHKPAYDLYLTDTGSTANAAAAAAAGDDGTGNFKAGSKPRFTPAGTAAASMPNSGSLISSMSDCSRAVLSSLLQPDMAQQLTVGLSSSSSRGSGVEQHVYKQMCTQSAVSLKLSGQHDVEAHGPSTHTSGLNTSIDTTTSSSSSDSGGSSSSRSGLSVVLSAFFRGSVQLLAVVCGSFECCFSATSSRGNDSSSSSSSSSGSGESSGAAAGLLQQLHGCLLGLSVQKSKSVALNVVWDKTSVISKSHSKQQQDADVAKMGSFKGPQLDFGQVCSTTGQSCRLQIMMTDATSTDGPGRRAAAAAPPNGSSRFRSLVVQQQTVLLDKETDLHSVEVTHSVAGVSYVALVPMQQQQQGILARVLMVLPAAAAAGGRSVTQKLALDATPPTHNPATTNLATFEISEIQDAGSEHQRYRSGGHGGSNSSSSSSSSEESRSGGDSYDTGSSGSEQAREISEGAGGSSSGGQARGGEDNAGGSNGAASGGGGGGGGDPPGGEGVGPGMPNLGDIFNGMFFLHVLVMVVVLLLLYLGVLKDPFLPAVGCGADDEDDADSGC